MGTMTANESKDIIGSTALLNAGSVEETRVTIKDFKQAYGCDRVLIENVLNKTTAWRNLSTLKIEAK